MCAAVNSSESIFSRLINMFFRTLVNVVNALVSHFEFTVI